MKIEMKNLQIVPAINFLSQLNLKGKASRSRMKLLKRLDEKRKEIAEEVRAVEHEKGSPEYNAEVAEIFNEAATTDLTEYADKMKILADALENYEGELSGKDAGIHDLLLDELEANLPNSEPQCEAVPEAE